MKKILIADDHPSIRMGVKLILDNELPEVEFGEASDGKDVMRMLRDSKWDALILDIDMPGRNGLEVLKQIKDEMIKIPVLVFSMHTEEQLALRVMKLGASGYLSKDAAGNELGKAINMLLQGRKYITSSLAEKLVSQLENPSDKLPHELLSEREFQTFLLIAKGRTITVIAEELSLSVPTISTYRTRILEKMNVKSNAEIASYAIRNGLI